MSGTKHLQGYIHFKNARSFEAVKKLLPRAHVEPQIATNEQAINYCKKPESKDLSVPEGERFWEGGVRPAQGARVDNQQIIEEFKAQKGDLSWLKDTYPSFFLRNCNGIKELAQHYGPQQHITHGTRSVYWICGPTGRGKTFSVMSRFGFQNVWVWDGTKGFFNMYENQPVALFDDIRADSFSFRDLLRLTDQYPHSVNVKGSSRVWNSRMIFFTCPEKPETLFYHVQEDKRQLYRRIKQVFNVSDLADGDFFQLPAEIVL